MTTQRTKTVFKRVERDDEFRQRLIQAGVEGYRVLGVRDEELDKVGWDRKRMQRRLIDDYA